VYARGFSREERWKLRCGPVVSEVLESQALCHEILLQATSSVADKYSKIKISVLMDYEELSCLTALLVCSVSSIATIGFFLQIIFNNFTAGIVLLPPLLSIFALLLVCLVGIYRSRKFF